MIAWRAAFAAVLGCVLAPGAAAHAQESRVQPEVRVDALVARYAALEGGIGVNIPAGYYVRIGLLGAAGMDDDAGFPHAAGRVDVTARFLLDPFRQTRWGLSVGGGVSVRAREADRARPYLLALMDLEGPRARGGWAPALQLGLGGGVRVGAGIRWGGERMR